MAVREATKKLSGSLFWMVDGMRRIEKIVLIKNAVETLGYFSEQLAYELEQLGLSAFFVDYDTLYESLAALPHFAEKGKTALITFNFIGLSGEDVFLSDGQYVWEQYEMEYLNILVDHPIYYHSRLASLSDEALWKSGAGAEVKHADTALGRLSSRMKIFCIDREHVAYIRRFYPAVEVHFLPIAGNRELPVDSSQSGQNLQTGKFALPGRNLQTGKCIPLPYQKRKYDLVFTANYVSFDEFYQKIEAMEPDYRQFYSDIIDDLLVHPAQSVDAVMERHINAELGKVSEREKRSAMAGMILVDLCARAYFRERILTELANGGCRVHLFGADWDRLRDNSNLCRHPENLILNRGQISSAECVRAMAEAKIALNVMPWFKDGAHDRVFTAMLQGAVALTDDSRYLREQFSDEKELVYYSLEKRGDLSGLAETLLEDEARREQIAGQGYQKAIREHTWKNRAEALIRYL